MLLSEPIISYVLLSQPTIPDMPVILPISLTLIYLAFQFFLFTFPASFALLSLVIVAFCLLIMQGIRQFFSLFQVFSLQFFVKSFFVSQLVSQVPFIQPILSLSEEEVWKAWEGALWDDFWEIWHQVYFELLNSGQSLWQTCKLPRESTDRVLPILLPFSKVCAFRRNS